MRSPVLSRNGSWHSLTLTGTYRHFYRHSVDTSPNCWILLDFDGFCLISLDLLDFAHWWRHVPSNDALVRPFPHTQPKFNFPMTPPSLIQLRGINKRINTPYPKIVTGVPNLCYCCLCVTNNMMVYGFYGVNELVCVQIGILKVCAN